MATDKDTVVTSAHTNPDAITGAPASHPGATGIGSVSGAATGAAIGAIGGPVGALIGGVAGAIVGGGVGHGLGEYNDPSDDAYWRDEYKNRSYASGTTNYDRDLSPAYRVGSALGATTTGTTFDDTAARTHWDANRGDSSLSYDQAGPAIRDAYDRKRQVGATTVGNTTTVSSATGTRA